MLRVAGFTRRFGSGITRIGTDDPRMSRIVKHGGTVYLSGQTAGDAGDCITAQTAAVHNPPHRASPAAQTAADPAARPASQTAPPAAQTTSH